MKWSNLFLLLLVGFIPACHKDCNECVEKIKPDCYCTLEYNPVCGCNNKTYSNACHAACAGIYEYTAGECPNVNKPNVFGTWNFMGYLNADAVDLDQPVKKHPYEIFIEFSDGQNVNKQYIFSGKAPVNTYGGLFTYAPPYTINISDLVTTEIAGSPEAMAYEAKYYQTLNAAITYEYYREVLLISTHSNAGKDKMVFVKRN